MAKKSNKAKEVDMFKTPVPKMPEGYYSGDKPNPNLRGFVEDHVAENPYDPETDDYDVPPFDKPINATKATAIYNMHTYWSKKPHDAIREYIRHYTKPGDLVLDPFCGSGGTALAALMEGRKAVAIDRSPAATFITKNYCTPVDVDELEEAFEELKEKVKPEIDWLYETKCDRCGGKATTAYTVYSQVFQCPRCMEKMPLFDCLDAESKTAKGKPKAIKTCPHCHERGVEEEIKTGSEKFGAIPVLVSYICEEGCKPKRDQRLRNDSDPRKRKYFEEYDLGKIKEIEEKEILYWYPPHKMMNVEDDTAPWGDNWRLGRNFRKIIELYTKRNLWALAVIKKNLGDYGVNEYNDLMLFAMQGILLINSRMCRASSTQTQNGTYYLPHIFKELCPINSVNSKIKVISEAQTEKHVSSNQLIISCMSSVSLDVIKSDSLDYVFTDPPYADKVQYGELNFIWEAWLGFDTHWHDEEIIINEVRGKTEQDWADMMLQAMKECHRVLKPGRVISLCYHDTSEGTWALLQDIMSKAGFVVEQTDSALFIDTGQKSYNQLVADKVNKRDLVVNFRKPKPGELSSSISITGDEDLATFAEKVLLIIRDCLEKNPGTTKDRIYDEVVSRMVRAGEMEAHDFDAFLDRVADEFEDRKWYLKETEAGSEASEQLLADDAAAKIEAFLIREAEKERQKSEEKCRQLGREKIKYEEILRLASEGKIPIGKPEKNRYRKQLEETVAKIEKLETERDEWGRHALHYTYISEFYFPLTPKPKLTLVDLLGDYFYKTDLGNWRPPLDDEERAEKKLTRQTASRRKITRFCNLITKGETIPDDIKPDDATLAEWIRHCKRAGLYGQGKLLYEKGGLNLDSLPEEAMANVEEDYQVCVRKMRHETRMNTDKHG